MSDRGDRDRYDRPSWKELDRRKDKRSGSGAGARSSKLDERKVTTGYHRYKQDLNSLFDSGEASSMVKEVLKKAPTQEGAKKDSKGPPERQKLLRQIREASSTGTLTRLLDEFLANWKLPDDIEILTQALDHPDEDVQRDALEKISSYLDGNIPKHANLLRGRVRKLASRSDDEDVAALAKAVNRKLPL
ncbi:MAG: hypothetical protein JRG91_10395 [Deltaproteobacteria bacterium]|nr:hypothetical protein [Deltaproteobacteria bacterium]